ncbi:hypothetical protein Scep_024074 [Stephania cephalantha]|uniref:Uncharacterized protein n=1 Tax=Stephania cephalantha TaxID=152367 RepID=A0AAP0F4T3_9MAGN
MSIPHPHPQTKIPKSHKFVVASRLALCSPARDCGVARVARRLRLRAFAAFPASQSSWDAFMGTDDSKSRARFGSGLGFELALRQAGVSLFLRSSSSSSAWRLRLC